MCIRYPRGLCLCVSLEALRNRAVGLGGGSAKDGQGRGDRHTENEIFNQTYCASLACPLASCTGESSPSGRGDITRTRPCRGRYMSGSHRRCPCGCGSGCARTTHTGSSSPGTVRRPVNTFSFFVRGWIACVLRSRQSDIHVTYTERAAAFGVATAQAAAEERGRVVGPWHDGIRSRGGERGPAAMGFPTPGLG